jgi:hypothetical protein
MPTSGTHITILQRIAASSNQMKALLGDPSAEEGTFENSKHKYACLGAVGPDILYAMMDYDSGLQDFTNFLIKIGGTFECMSELSEQINRYVTGIENIITLDVVDSIQKTSSLISATIKEGFLAILVDAGFNFFPVFESRRQQDQKRENWFWADYLHYVRSGEFTKYLIENSRNDERLHAYALGYLTHYVTDVVGHPYVNQVVQAPWRLYWQRHHLVENFIDAYVWDRWHTSQPEPAPPSTEEQPLDLVNFVPNPTGAGAPMTFARLNDLINIGSIDIGDPADTLIKDVCQTIEDGLMDVGLAVDAGTDEVNDPELIKWANFFRKCMIETYSKIRHPHNFTTGRTDGFANAEDIISAYSLFRIVMRISTEDEITEPQPPDIVGDISEAVQQLLNDIQNDLGGIPPPPIPSTSGSFSWDSLWDAIKDFAQWIADVAEHVIDTIVDTIKDLINLGGTIVSDSIKYALYLLNKLIFALYRSFRDVLVYAGYTLPFTDQLSVNIAGPFGTRSLWTSMGNLREGRYPIEEIPEERKEALSSYAPFVPPIVQNNRTEEPFVSFTAPYEPSVAGGGFLPSFTVPASPDNFIDAPVGPDNMFLMGSLQPPVVTSNNPPQNSPINTFSSNRKDFGGAIANCIHGIHLAEKGFTRKEDLPNYNLDGDRGYAWVCWDVCPNVSTTGQVFDPLNPDVNPGQIAHVNAKSLEDPACNS